MGKTNRWRQALGGMLLSSLLAGCAAGAAGTSVSALQTQTPQTAQELIAAAPGPLAGIPFYLKQAEQRDKITHILDGLPLLPDGMDESLLQVYWAKLLQLFAEDYLSPRMVVDRWRMASFGGPDIEDARFRFREHFNVEIILDASGSMREKMGEKSKMEQAKEAIREFAESLPKEASVSLRVYGHVGSGSDADKALSCSRSDIVYPLQTYDAAKLDDALGQIEPSGWTSIAYSLQQAQQDLAAFPAKSNTNVIYLVSDGIETCGGDPVAVAEKLYQSDIMPLLNVIGFDVNAEGQQQLKEIARASEGLYANVTNRDQFRQELERAREIAEKWEQWKRDAMTEAAAVLIDRRKWIDAYERDWYEKKLARKPEHRGCHRLFVRDGENRRGGEALPDAAADGQRGAGYAGQRGADRLPRSPDQQDVSGNADGNRTNIQRELVSSCQYFFDPVSCAITFAAKYK